MIRTSLRPMELKKSGFARRTRLTSIIGALRPQAWWLETLLDSLFASSSKRSTPCSTLRNASESSWHCSHGCQGPRASSPKASLSSRRAADQHLDTLRQAFRPLGREMRTAALLKRQAAHLGHRNSELESSHGTMLGKSFESSLAPARQRLRRSRLESLQLAISQALCQAMLGPGQQSDAQVCILGHCRGSPHRFAAQRRCAAQAPRSGRGSRASRLSHAKGHGFPLPCLPFFP